ncbi:uncharacterized protein [Ptychodera flava]|uniref:uncharacterized protein n=1 Tax=Ptychodera flava TaxID=63121 RepID=UPI003969CD63
MVDTRLPFGAAQSPEIFTRITQSITRMMRRKGYDVVIVYLHDFLIIADSNLACEQAFNALQQLLQQLGFSINWEMVVEPTQCLTFLGIEINAHTRTLSLDGNKLQELSDLLEYWLPKRRATKRELQQLIGKLNWAARVIRGGRTFLRRLIDVTNSVSRQSHHIRLNRQARADISWWANLSKSFNGTAFFIEETPLPQQIFTTDACSAAGAGIYANYWFYTRWSADHPTTADAHINLKELYTRPACVQAVASFLGQTPHSGIHGQYHHHVYNKLWHVTQCNSHGVATRTLLAVGNLQLSDYRQIRQN